MAWTPLFETVGQQTSLIGYLRSTFLINLLCYWSARLSVDLADSRVLLHSVRIIVDASIELMRAESFSNESLPVNLSENSNGLET